MTKFRPCIDLHEGKVKQIVGSSLSSDKIITNFTSDISPVEYAKLYKKYNLRGGHIISLGPGNEKIIKDILREWPGEFQVGGGIHSTEDAEKYLPEKVIVTSYLFPGGKFSMERLKSLSKRIGKSNLVVDFSCKKMGENVWIVVMDKWKTLTDLTLTKHIFDVVKEYCCEFLIHSCDVEGLCAGIDQELVRKLAVWCDDTPVTYAGGAKDINDLDLVKILSNGKVDLTLGSCLDIFGGRVRLEDCVEWNERNSLN